MKSENRQNIFLLLFIGAVLVMAVIYFAVPERKELIEFNIEWWRDFFSVMGTVASFCLVL